MHGLRPEVLVLRRSDVDQIKRLLRSFQVTEGICVPHLRAVGKSSDRQILLDGGDRFVPEVNESAARSTLAKRLNADGAAAREQVEDVHAFNSRSKDVKKGSLDAIEN